MKTDLNAIKEKIDGLCTRLNNAHQILHSLRSDQFEEVRKAFLANLGLDQLSVISRLSKLNRWKNLEGLLTDVEQYVTQLEDTVLNPERAELLGAFRRWLHELNIERDEIENWLKATLEKASRDSVLQLNQKLLVLHNTWETLEDTTSKCIVTAENNEIVKLKKMDRTPSNFSEWLDAAANAISKTSELQIKEKCIQREITTNFNSAPQNHISQKFNSQIGNLNQRLMSKRNFDEIVDFCNTVTEEIDSQWEILKAKMPILAGQYKILTKQARTLISKDIVAWKLKRLSDISTQLDSIFGVIGKVIQTQSVLDNIKRSSNSVKDLPKIPTAAKPLIGELKKLSVKAEKLGSVPSLKDYQKDLDELVGKFQDFTTKLEDQRKRWIVQTAAWINACIKTGLDPPKELQQQLIALKEMDGTINLIGEILRCRLELTGQMTDVQRMLADILPRGEFQIYKAVTQLEEKREVSIADLEAQFGKLDAVSINNILALVNKDLLKVKISAKG